MPNGHPTKLPSSGDVVIEALLAAFEAGDPAQAFKSAQDLIAAYRLLYLEAAKLRFQVNFGTDVYVHCEGLHAGPGVSATCFQIQQCNYCNLKDGAGTPHQAAIIKKLCQD